MPDGSGAPGPGNEPDAVEPHQAGFEAEPEITFEALRDGANAPGGQTFFLGPRRHRVVGQRGALRLGAKRRDRCQRVRPARRSRELVSLSLLERPRILNRARPRVNHGRASSTSRHRSDAGLHTQTEVSGGDPALCRRMAVLQWRGSSSRPGGLRRDPYPADFRQPHFAHGLQRPCRSNASMTRILLAGCAVTVLTAGVVHAGERARKARSTISLPR